MVRCGHCGKYISSKGVAACCKCDSKFHVACVNIPDSAKVSSKWVCPGCKNKDSTVKSTPAKGENRNADGTPASSYDSSKSAAGSARSDQAEGSVGHEIKMLRAEMRSMRDDLMAELREFRLEMADLRQSVAACKAKVNNFETRLEILEKRQVPPSEEIEHTIQELKTELNEREQELLLSDVEITGLPEDTNENAIHSVELVARKLGVKLDSQDIVFAERVGPRFESAGKTGEPGVAVIGRRIVVRLTRRGLRDELLRSARVRRGATSEGLGFDAPPRRFYINERLTRTNRQLFYRTRQLAASLGWRYTWTKRGKILTREADGKRTHTIRSESDLERVFGQKAIQASSD